MKRRTFLTASLTAAAATEAFGYPQDEVWVDGHNKPHFQHKLHFEHSYRGEVLIKSGASPKPRKLVKREVIDSIWGVGAYDVMRQPLHWHMIDNGWFNDEDLWYPFDGDTDERNVWLAYHQPACEAHDLVCEVFGMFSSFIEGASRPELGLYCVNHPSTPRYVTAKLRDVSWIPAFKEAVETKTRFISVDESRIEPSPYE